MGGFPPRPTKGLRPLESRKKDFLNSLKPKQNVPAFKNVDECRVMRFYCVDEYGVMRF